MNNTTEMTQNLMAHEFVAQIKSSITLVTAKMGADHSVFVYFPLVCIPNVTPCKHSCTEATLHLKFYIVHSGNMSQK